MSFEKFKIDVMESEHVTDQDRRRSVRGPSSPYANTRPDESTADKESDNNIEAEVTKLVSTMVDSVCEELKIGSGDHQNLLRKESGLAKPAKRQEFRPSATPKPVYRTPEFRWSHIHIKLLSDLLLLIESDVATWKK